MALISCPECKKEISGEVSACPTCGHPISQPLSDIHDKTSSRGNFISRLSFKVKVIILIVAALIITLIALLLSIHIYRIGDMLYIVPSSWSHKFSEQHNFHYTPNDGMLMVTYADSTIDSESAEAKDNMLDSVFNDFVDTSKPCKNIDKQYMYFNSDRALSVVFDWDLGKGFIPVHYYSIYHGNKVYIFNLGSNPGTEAWQDKVLHKVLKSVVFK